MSNHTEAVRLANYLAHTHGAKASDVHTDSIITPGGGRAGVIQFTLTKGDIVRTITMSAGGERRYEIGNADWEVIDAGTALGEMNDYLRRSFE